MVQIVYIIGYEVCQKNKYSIGGNYMSEIITLDEIKELVKPVVKQFPVKTLILYGSYARNKATEESDIDLIVDSNDKLLGWGLCSLIGELAEVLPKPFHCYEKSMIINSGELFENIQKDGIVLYET